MLLWLICTITIWILIIPIIFSFLKRETPIRKASLLSVIGYIFSLFYILDYTINEALIFASMFISHMIRIIQFVADVMSFCSFVAQFIFQTLFLVELKTYCKRYSKTFLLRVRLSDAFNKVLLMHMVIIAIYSLRGIFENWSTVMNYVNFPLVLGLVEFLYRCYAAWCYYLFHLRNRTVSLTSSESVEEKSYRRTYDRVAGFGSNLQFVSTEHFTADTS